MILINLFLTFLSKYSNMTDARIADNRAPLCNIVASLPDTANSSCGLASRLLHLDEFTHSSVFL